MVAGAACEGFAPTPPGFIALVPLSIRDFLRANRRHQAVKVLRQIPSICPLRAAQLVALMQTLHRFRSKRQLWTYSGLAVETHDSAQYRYVDGQLQRSKKPKQGSRSQSESQSRDEGDLQKRGPKRHSSCGGSRFSNAILFRSNALYRIVSVTLSPLILRRAGYLVPGGGEPHAPLEAD